MKKSTHKKRLIEEMLNRDDVTCCTVTHIANANQYFCELEKEGICKSRWGLQGKARVKFRFIPNDMIEKALKYIGIASADSVQGSH